MREVYSSEYRHGNIRDISNNLLTQLKAVAKPEQTKPKSSRWREVIKIMAEINEIKIIK